MNQRNKRRRRFWAQRPRVSHKATLINNAHISTNYATKTGLVVTKVELTSGGVKRTWLELRYEGSSRVLPLW